PVGCSRAATRSAGRCMRLLPRVGRRRCTPAFGPLARITRADTRPLACRSGEAPEGKLAPCYPLLPAHRTQRGRTLQAAGEASCAEYAAWRATTTDRPPAPPLPRSFPEVEGWGSTRWHAAQEEWKPSRSRWTCPLKPSPLGEPEVAIGPRRDAYRQATRRRDRELGEFVLALQADAPDVFAPGLGE